MFCVLNVDTKCQALAFKFAFKIIHATIQHIELVEEKIVRPSCVLNQEMCIQLNRDHVMTKKIRTHLSTSDSMQDSKLTPKHLTKQEFGRRLNDLMKHKGWHQSELARRAGLQRDSISTYVRGRTLPTPKNLKALAQALDIKPEALLPNHTESAIDADHPAFELRVSQSDPDFAWVRVNRLVKLSTATKIIEILQEDTSDRSREGA